MKRLAITLVMLWSAACADDSPTGPSSPSPWLGTWVATLDTAVTGAGTLRLDIGADSPSGSGRVLSGTWSATFARPGFDDAGALNGARGGEQLVLTLTSASAVPCASPPGGTPLPPFSLMVQGTPPTAAGTYVFWRCDAGTTTGPIELRRQ